MTTVQDCYNIAYAIIKSNEAAVAYPPALLLSFLNKAQTDVCMGAIMNIATGERLVKLELPFLSKIQYYSTIIPPSLSADAVVGGTTMSMDTTNLPSSGYFWINGAVISYSGKTVTTVTGIPATGQRSIPFAFPAGTKCYPVFALPTDFGQIERVFLNIQSTQQRYRLISIDERDLDTPVPQSYIYNFFRNIYLTQNEYYYSIVGGGQFFFPLVPQMQAYPIQFLYQMKPTVMTATTDTVTLPDPYALSILPYLSMAEMMINRGESDEGTKLYNFGFQNVRNMYQAYQSARKELQFDRRVRTIKDGNLNYF